MRWLIKFDGWLMSQTQRAYLWLYDWTGVYVATISLAMTSLFVWSLGATIIGLVVLGIRGLVEALRYYEQSTEKFDKFNRDARNWQNSALRWFCSSSFVVFFVLDAIVRRDGWSVVGDAAFFAFSYMYTVQIREREPREFWRLSPQGAGS